MSAIYYDITKRVFIEKATGKEVTPKAEDWLINGMNDAKYLPDGFSTYQYGISMTKIRNIPSGVHE
jgi:hypothetical protein